MRECAGCRSQCAHTCYIAVFLKHRAVLICKRYRLYLKVTVLVIIQLKREILLLTGNRKLSIVREACYSHGLHLARPYRRGDRYLTVCLIYSQIIVGVIVRVKHEAYIARRVIRRLLRKDLSAVYYHLDRCAALIVDIIEARADVYLIVASEREYRTHIAAVELVLYLKILILCRIYPVISYSVIDRLTVKRIGKHYRSSCVRISPVALVIILIV